MVSALLATRFAGAAGPKVARGYREQDQSFAPARLRQAGELGWLGIDPSSDRSYYYVTLAAFVAAGLAVLNLVMLLGIPGHPAITPAAYGEQAVFSRSTLAQGLRLPGVARAVLDGLDLGKPVRARENPSIGQVRLSARPAFVVGRGFWKTRDQEEYRRTVEELRRSAAV